MRALVLLLLAAAAPAADLRYWVEPCTRPETSCRPGDPEQARIRIHWLGPTEGLYGETLGGDVYVRPAVVPPGERDTLLREAVVYLTCLHETGHALGLPHTAAFADIMYSFQYGGDLREYFGRYRRLLKQRGDIRKHAGISDADRAAVRAAR